MKKNQLILGLSFLAIVFVFLVSTIIINANSDRKNFVVNKSITVSNQKYDIQGKISYTPSNETNGSNIDDENDDDIDNESNDIGIIDFEADIQDIEVGKKEIVTFTARVDYTLKDTEKIAVISEEGSLLGYLYDNGEGVYTNSFEMLSEIKMKIGYYACIDSVKSNTVYMYYFNQLTQENIDLYKSIDEAIKEIENDFKDEVSAKDVYNKIIEYLDQQIQLGNILKYNCNQENITITLKDETKYVYSFDLNNELQSSGSISFDKSTYKIMKTNNANQKIITLQSYADELKSTVFDNVATNVAESDYNYEFSDNLDNSSVSLESMKKLKDYRVIIIDTHGGYSEELHSFFGTGERINDDKQISLSADLDSGRIIRLKSGNYGITSEFFERYYKDNSFNDTLMYIGACHGMDDDVLWNTLIRKGVKTVLGYQNSVRTFYNRSMCETIFQELVKTKSDGKLNTIAEAVEVAKSKNGAKDASPWDWLFGNYAELFVKGKTSFRLTDNPKIMGTISGRVVDEEGNPIQGASISMFDSFNNGVPYSALTDEKGGFTVDSEPGKHIFIVTKENYKSYASYIVTVSNGTMTILFDNIVLKKDVKESGFPGGDGTKGNPYQVANAEQLNAVRNDLSAHYVQISDIDLSGYSDWKPIGNLSDTAFIGSYNGQGYKISNLTISNEEYIYVGLFGTCKAKSVVSNINLDNINITINKVRSGILYVGGIAGISESNINDCTVSGIINISDFGPYFHYAIIVGGILGNGNVNASTSSSSISVLSKQGDIYCGGITGTGGGRKSINYGDIKVEGSGNLSCGGISARAGKNGYCYYCINYGQINVKLTSGDAGRTGGIIGQDDGGAENCINFGNIDTYYSGNYYGYTGGIGTGLSQNVKNCYNICDYINSNEYVGRIIGKVDGYVENCYSLDRTKINEVLPTQGIEESKNNGASMTEEEISQAVQYIFEELEK